MQSYSVEFIYLFYNLFNITLRSYPLVKVAYWCHFFLFLRDSRLDRADEKTMIYQMAHCVLFFFWQRDPTEYWDEGPAWIFWGREREKKSVKFLGASVFSVTFCIGLNALTADIVLLLAELWFGASVEITGGYGNSQIFTRKWQLLLLYRPAGGIHFSLYIQMERTCALKHVIQLFCWKTHVPRSIWFHFFFLKSSRFQRRSHLFIMSPGPFH